MDRKGLLIIIAAIGIIFGYQYFVAWPQKKKNDEKYRTERAEYDKKMEEFLAAEKARIAANPPPVVTPGAPTPGAPAPGAPAPVPVVPPVPLVVAKSILEDTKTVSSEVGTVQYVFTPHGAGIARVILTDHFADKDKKTNIVLNEFGTFPIGAISELDEAKLRSSDRAIWLTEANGQIADPLLVNQTWDKFDIDEKAHTVTFVREDKLRSLRITKKFSLPVKPDENDPRKVKLRSEYLVHLEVTYENLSTEARLAPRSYVHLGGSAPINQFETVIYQGFDYWRDGSNNSRTADWFSAGGMLFWSHPERPVLHEDVSLVRWGAVTNQYFTTMVTILGAEDKPENDQLPVLGSPVWAKRTTIAPDDWRKPTPWRPAGHELTKTHALYQIDGAIGLKESTVMPGAPVTRSFQIYAGPREYRRLRLLDHHESDVLDYGSFLGIPTGPFSRLLLNTMNLLYAYVTFNYALAIILLTIIVKAILWPLQNKANKNMKKMADLQPEMKLLQDKYKGDPQRFQQEMGKMWKKAGVNPLGGCWPIFIQVPIFIGFYNMLGKAVELRHHTFLWVKDLAAPDTVGHLWGLGWPINPLPLLMAATMFLQMKMAPQGGDPMQRKIFMFMPLIFVFMCYDFASALALYWTVQNIISIVQLMVNRNKTPVPAKVQLAK